VPYLDVEGARIAYDREGAGRPVVLVHGAAQDSTVWREVTAHLRGEFDVIAPDLPGHGKSERWRGDIVRSVEVYADFLLRFTAALRLECPVLVGHSMGGATCLRAASRRVEAMSAVVNVAGAAESGTAGIGYPGNLLELVAVNPTDWMETNFYSLFGRNVPPARRWELAFDARRVAPEVVLGDLAAYVSCDFLDELSRIEVPVLSVAGEDDWSCSPERVRMSHDMVAAEKRYVVLESVGHLPQLEVPMRLGELVRQFLGAARV
jgi:3-oxoadipate enol-lactonase